MTDIRRPEQLIEKLEADLAKVDKLRDSLKPDFSADAVRKLTEFAEMERGGPGLLQAEEICLGVIDEKLRQARGEVDEARLTIIQAILACQTLAGSLKNKQARR